jgi:hypothetical protein
VLIIPSSWGSQLGGYLPASGEHPPFKAVVIANSHGDCTACKDQINKTMHETSVGSQVVSTSWYAQLSAEKKEGHLNKQRIARQQKNRSSKLKYF